jgi:hypothetical protein
MSARASSVRFFRGFCRLFAAFLLGGILAPSLAIGAGVTLITHGLNGDTDGWITAMANAIPNFTPLNPTNFTCYELYLVPNGKGYQVTANRVSGNPPLTTDAAEIIIKLDWRQIADGNSSNTYQVARMFIPALLTTNFIPELGGHAIVELPLHFIGHSRGGSLICELSRELGTNGVWVDHISNLDAHPLNDPSFPLDGILYSAVDAPARSYENVLFSDSYWQDLDSVVHGTNVFGAFVRKLTNLSGGGYSGTGADHSDVHLWYHGTINTNTPISYVDSGSTITINGTMRTNWWSAYESHGMNAGFLYSLLEGGDRFSLDHPVAGQGMIVDGFNQHWDLGAGTSTNNRAALPANNGQWANLILLDRTSTNDVSPGQSTSVAYYYQWSVNVTNQATVNIYLDDDFNPFNGNETALKQFVVPASGGGSVGFQNVSFTLPNVAPGDHALFATITAGGRTRYLYAPELLRVTVSLQAPILDVAQLAPGQFDIGINGVIGQTIVLQESADLQSWFPIATNTLATSRWDYTNSASADQQFFRAILGQ